MARWCAPEHRVQRLHDLLRSREIQCTDAYTAPRCSACAAGYYRISGRCQPCAAQAYVTVALFVAVLIGAVSLGWLLMKLHMSLGPFTIAVDFFQVLGREAGVAADWGIAASLALSWTNAFDFSVNLLVPNCVVDVEYATTWAAIMATPVVALLLLLVVQRPWRRQGALDSFISHLLLLGQLMYMILVQKAVEAVDCVTLPNGKQVLEASPDMECWSGKHALLAAGGVLAILVYVVGIPAGFCAALRRLRRATLGKDHERWLRITDPLRDETRDWVLVVMLRKLLLSAGVALNSSRPAFQLLISSAVLALALALQSRYRPYRSLLGDAAVRARLPPSARVLLNANTMENSAMAASFVVVTGGLMTLNGKRAVEEGKMEGWVLYALDAGVALAIVATTCYMIVLTVGATVLLRRQAAGKAAVASSSSRRVAVAAVARCSDTGAMQRSPLTEGDHLTPRSEHVTPRGEFETCPVERDEGMSQTGAGRVDLDVEEAAGRGGDAGGAAPRGPLTEAIETKGAEE